jgi:putative endonuclease
MNRVSVGKRYEDEVAVWLDKHGYSILARNFRFRHKEIDIIAEKENLLVFVEVKYRKDGAFGTGLEAVTVSKRRNVRTAALYYIEKNRRYDCNVRFDVATFEREKLLYIEDAFQLTK